MLVKHEIPIHQFREWLWKDRENKMLFALSSMLVVLQFLVLKILYPFPNFMPPDSVAYVEAAYYNYSINVWPIGYSKFLRLFHYFTTSHFALVLFQYLFLQVSLLYLLYSIRFLLMPGKWVFRIVLAFCISNPMFLHISNFVSSDALFTALSLIWVTQLLWILDNPKLLLLVAHASILLFVFMVRYNSIFYPFLSFGAIFITNLSIKRKAGAVCLIIVFLGTFIARTCYHYYSETGTIQYSPFSGWLLASNALYGYAHVPHDAPEELPAKFRHLHRTVNQHMDSINYLPQRPDNEVAIYYLWDLKSPLKTYMYESWRNDSTTGIFKRWLSMAPLYSEYGKCLIMRHPRPFLKHFLLPNLVQFYVPPTKFMGIYNLGDDRVSPILVQWFKLKSDRVTTFSKNKMILVSIYFPIASAVSNLLFLLGFFMFSFQSGFRTCASHCKRILVLIFAVWICNLIFSVVSAPIELRYQLFSIVVAFVFGVLFSEFALCNTFPMRKPGS